MSTSYELDALEVLNHLNAMGYKNITADALKAFMKDLKKFIKYDKNICIVENVSQSSYNVFNKLNEITISREAKMVNMKDQLTKLAPKVPLASIKSSSDGGVIKKDFSKQDLCRDPVALYHFYNEFWQKFSRRIPRKSSTKGFRQERQKQMYNTKR